MTPAERARLHALRIASGLSYARLAERAGLGTMQVFKVLSGDIPDPRVGTLRKIVEALGGTMADVFAREAEPGAESPPAQP